MERDLTVKTNSSITGFSSLAQTNGVVAINVQYADSTQNIGVEPVELKDPRTSQLEILDQRKLINSIEGIECELLISQGVQPVFEVDVDGSIYVSDIVDEATNYQINNMAELEFNFVI
jgi:hypothetical protein